MLWLWGSGFYDQLVLAVSTLEIDIPLIQDTPVALLLLGCAFSAHWCSFPPRYVHPSRVAMTFSMVPSSVTMQGQPEETVAHWGVSLRLAMCARPL